MEEECLLCSLNGKCGKAFVSELARLFHAYAAGSALESIALKAVTVGSVLLLQKPPCTSKSRDHVECLEQRLKSWKDGDIQTLLHEGKTIQHRLPTFHNTNPSTENSPVVRSFTKLMLEGKCKAAINLLTESTRGGCLKLDTVIPSEHSKQFIVLDALLEKHPANQAASPDIILMNSSTPPTPHPIIFDSIDASTIRAAALHTDGSAGPSGIDARGWRRLCSSFHSSSTDLCHSLALMARRLCSSFVDPQSLAPFLSCHLIALDKNPGVRR